MLQPSAANSRAHAAPIPPDAPVTSTRFPPRPVSTIERLRPPGSSSRVERPKDWHMAPSDDLTELDVGLAVLDALDPDYELTPEALDIRAWRFEQLVAHGYEIDDAMKLAKASDVDLERARV